MAAACLSLALAAWLVSPADAAEGDCAPSGGYGFVCGMKNPEDLVLVPGTNWIIASGMAAGGALYLIDSQQKTWTELYPGETPRADHDTKTYGACPGAPAREGFVTHGLNITRIAEGQSRLAVVVHGAREAVEVFDVDASGETPVLTWRGCVPTPEAMEANSVASLADGSLLVTIPLRTGIQIGVALAGKPTGAVYRWSPGDDGMTVVPGTELPYANGIEVSADGKEFYVASSGLATVLAYSNTDPARLLRSTEQLTFIPDNLHSGPDGRLLTAGLNLVDETCGNVKQSEEFSLEEFASCPRPFTVVAVDPRSMQVDVVATGPPNPQFSNITMALPVGDELWIGTFAGDRVAYGRMNAGGKSAQSAAERYPVRAPRVLKRGLGMKEKWLIGEYAVSNREIGSTVTDTGPDGAVSRLKFALDIEASDGTNCRVEGKQRRKEPAREKKVDLWEVVQKETLGISNVASPLPYAESVEASITTAGAEGAAWQLVATRNWTPGSDVHFEGTVTRGARKLDVRSRSVPAGVKVAIDIDEEGEWLCAAQEGEYLFRPGLDPQLKVALLGALEALTVQTVQGDPRAQRY